MILNNKLQKATCNYFSTSMKTLTIVDIMKKKDSDLDNQATNLNMMKELVIENDCFRNSKCHLIISNYPNLEKILIKRNNLSEVESLIICDNEHLKEIEVEDIGEEREYEQVFGNVKSVILESDCILLILMSISS